MKQYIFDASGGRVHDGLNFEKSEKLEKTLTTLSGDGDWMWLYGSKMMVDPAGIVIKGPDLFIGRTYDDLKNLNYNDVFTVERSVMRAVGATNKSINPDDPTGNIEKARIIKEAKVWFDKLLKTRVAEGANRFTKDPMYTVKPE